MQIVKIALAALCLFARAEGAELSAGEIMAKVAANQDRAQAARNQFVYQQSVHRTLRRKDGKVMQEEFWLFDMLPGETKTEKKLVSVKGRYWTKGRYIPFEGEPVPDEDFLNMRFDDEGEGSRDGIDKDLFPLTSEKQKTYTFERIGERVIKGRQAYQIRFRPTDRNDYGWSGEALIDEEEFQPVTVYTRLSRKLPLAVRTMLGTDVPGLGFNVSYARIDKDIWFPASYGTEFAVRALFFLNRTITESTENTNFRRATAESEIQFGDGSEW